MSDGRRYSKVYRRMWNDARFRALSPAAPCGQVLWLRLLTGPELTNIPGVFAIGEAALAEALGWPVEGFRKAFAEVSREGLAKADWRARVVFVPKAITYNAPESPNVIRSWRSAWDELPECALKTEAHRTLRAFVEGMGEGFRKAFAEALPEPSANQEQEQEQEQEKIITAPSALAEAARAEVPTDAGPGSTSSRAKAPRGSRLSPDWSPGEELEAWARGLGVDPVAVLAEFRDYWCAVPGAKGVKLDWGATFRNRIREVASRRSANGRARGPVQSSAGRCWDMPKELEG